MTGRVARASLVLVGLSLWIGRGVDVGPINLQAIQVATVLVALAVLATALRDRAAPLAWLRPRTTALLAAAMLGLTAIVVAAALSALTAIEPLSVLRFIARYLLGAVLLLSVLHVIKRPANAWALERALFAGAWLSVAVSAVAYFVPQLAAVAIRYGDRAQGLLNHPNQLAMLLTALAPVAFAAALQRPRRAAPWLTLLAVGAGVALTGSKVNLAVLAVVLPVMGLLAARLRRGALSQAGAAAGLTIAGLTVTAAAVWVVQAANPRTLVTIGRLFTDPMATSAVATRTETWRLAIAQGLEQPWIGVGADNAGFYLAHDHAHNVFVEFFLTLGVVGLVALTLLLVALAAIAGHALWPALTRSALASGDRLRLIAYPLAMLAYVAASQSSDSFGGTTLPVLWLMTALASAQVDRCSA